jgi:alginate O-acetyltransferase complex protein AlgI
VLFTEAPFLFLFLPLLLGTYLLAPTRFRNGLLAIASILFYSWDEPAYTAVLLGSIALNFVAGFALDSYRGTRARRVTLTLAIIANLGLLGFFKYAGFFVDSLNAPLELLGLPPLPVPRVELPLGISFFTFQAMSYVVDVHRGTCPAQRNILNLSLYIALFPQLIAGPIVRYKEIAAQIRERVLTQRMFAEGVRRFVFGLGKKMLIADTIAQCVDAIFELPGNEITITLAWAAIVGYALQIYFDFSGYSDMAVGLGKMFGFRIPENFRYPYSSRSVTEFWRRWHITLSAWFRDYVYIPLGGNRVRRSRTYLNLAAVFLLCGLWHGATWNFIIWGAFHGALLIVERLAVGSWLRRAPAPFAHIYTMIAILIGWVWFRAESLPAAMEFLGVMFGGREGAGVHLALRNYLTNEVIVAMLLGIILATPAYPALRTRIAGYVRAVPGREQRWRRLELAHHAESLVLLAVLALSIIWIAALTYSPFIYFRF